MMQGNTYYKHMLRSDPCVYCGAYEPKKKYKNGEPAVVLEDTKWSTIDHIMPENFGGASHWFNYAPCCARCNSMKGNRSVLHFMLEGNLAPSLHHHHDDSLMTAGHKQSNHWQLPPLWFDPCKVMGNVRKSDKERYRS